MVYTKYLSAASALAICLSPAVVFAQNGELPAPYEGAVDFKADILPILQVSCIECHGADVQKSDLRMDSRQALLDGGIEGPSIIVGNSAESLLVQVSVGAHEFLGIMPPEGDGEPLTSEQVAKLRTWIDSGAEWPEDVVIDMATLGKAEGLPDSWRVEATNQSGVLADWALLSDVKGPGDTPAFGVTAIHHDDPKQLNLLWTDARKLQNGMVEGKVKAISGEGDQGGGLIWRVKDKQNYYLARYNPKVGDFRVYKMVDGQVEALATVEVTGAEEGWDTIRIEQDGDAIVAYFNEEKVAEVSDNSLPDAGGVGYWTKGDAVSAFSGSKLEPK